MSDFTVNDRRAFPKNKGQKDGGAEGPAPSGSVPGTEAGTDAGTDNRTEAGTEAKSGKAGGQARPEFPATFTTLIIGLAASAMMKMGAEPPDGGTEPETDLPQAKHHIDILAELQKKTAGNLSDEESNLLNTFLYDLRLRYVQLS
jgi:hypothetical protein